MCPENACKTRPPVEDGGVAHWNVIDNLDNWEGNLLMTGDGGAGKTTKLKEIYDTLQDKEITVCTTTHKAKAVLLDKGFNPDDCRTLESLMCSLNRS